MNLRQYITTRSLAFILDLLISCCLALFFSAIINAGSYVAALRDIVTIEAESLSNKGFVEKTSSRASTGTYIATPDKAKATGTFSGKDGIYDIVAGYFDGRNGSSEVHITIGDHSLLIKQTVNENDMVWEAIGRNLEIKNGDLMEITAITDDADYANLDFLEFVPANSWAFRPLGARRSYRYRHLYQAIGYDDMNIHMSLLKVPVYMLLYGLVMLSFTNYTCGLYLFGLRVVGQRKPSFQQSLRRQLGNILTCCSLGIGNLFILFTRHRQSWGDILSNTLIVESTRVSTTIFSRGRTLTAYDSVTHTVSNSYRIVATAIDIILVALVSLLVRATLQDTSHQQPIRIEAEDFTYSGALFEPSLWASNQAYVAWESNRSVEMNKIFTGPSAMYDVYIAYENKSDDGTIRITTPSKSAEHFVDIDTRGNYVSRMLTNSPINSGDPLQITILEGKWLLDYVELRQPLQEGFYLTEQKSLLDEYWQFAGIRDSDIYMTLSLTGCAYVLLYLLALSLTGYTPGTWMTGYKITTKGSEDHPPLPQVLHRLLLHTVAPVRCFIQLVLGIDIIPAYDRIFTTEIFFAR